MLQRLYDEQTDRVELTTALEELALSYIRTPYYGARNKWLTDAGFPITLLNWTLGVSNRQKYPTAYTFNLRKKIKYMHVPHKAVFEWALLFFKIFSLGFKLPDFFLKKNTLLSIVINIKS